MKISAVRVFQNGMCMVFDESGNQVPDLQGRWSEVKERVHEMIAAQGGGADIEENVDWGLIRNALLRERR